MMLGRSLALRAWQAVSILYKTRLPLLLVFNKVDVMAHDFAVDWMKDYEVFRAAIAADSTYAAELSRSLCLARTRRLHADCWVKVSLPQNAIWWPGFKNYEGSSAGTVTSSMIRMSGLLCLARPFSRAPGCAWSKGTL